jgi:flagellar hook-length control protein FliK
MAAMQATTATPGQSTTSPAGAQPQLGAASNAGDSPEDAASAELAAAIAAMLVAVAPAGGVAADAGSGANDGSSADGVALQSLDGESAAAPDAALNRLLQALSQRLSKSTTDAASNAAMPAGDSAPAPLLPPRMVDAAAAALVAAARQPELLPAAETPAQPSAQSLASSLASTMGPTPQSQAAVSAAATTLHAAVGTPRWSEELGSRMVLMSLHGQHEGSLNLTPEHLGPLEVRLSVNHGTASVWFGSQHADTRAALTEALPRLRELFADAGLQLGHTGVSHEAPRQGTRDSEAARFGGESGADAVDGTTTVAPVTRRMALGLVDTYA